MINVKDIEYLIQTWGQHETDFIVGEELSELTKAYSKARRYELETCAPCNLSFLIENLKEEIADVFICIEMIKSHFHISSSDIESAVKDKMQRNIDRATSHEGSTHFSEQNK